MVVPEAIVTVFEPSSADATKSLPEASATVRFTVRSALGAASAVTVNSAAVPSVTAEPPVIVMVGPELSVRMCRQPVVRVSLVFTTMYQ